MIHNKARKFKRKIVATENIKKRRHQYLFFVFVFFWGFYEPESNKVEYERIIAELEHTAEET